MNATAPVEGLVLRRDAAGERHLRLMLLDPRHGVTALLYRPQSKSGTAMVTPDLFDEAEVFPDTPRGEPGKIAFVKEYRLIRRRPGLAKQYTRLATACRLASLLADNPHPPESWPALHALASTALDALESRPAPEVTLLKFLWKLARDEGWPVREHWAQALPGPLAESLRTLLATPLDAVAPASIPAAVELTTRLEQWLAREAHYVVKHHG